MKHTILAALILGSFVTAPSSEAANDTNVWPMFRRADIVTLEGKDIPADYKRTKITDAQGRSIDGEWLVIDRSAKKIKVRRAADGEEFEIPFASLSEPDRRYAELENGEVWGTNPRQVNVVFPEDTPDTITLTNGETIKGKWLSMQSNTVTFRGIDNKTQRLPITELSEESKAIVQRGFDKYLQRSKNLDPAEPLLSDDGSIRPNTLFQQATEQLFKAYSAEEIYDHLRVRTLTTYFLLQYYEQYLQSSFEKHLDDYKKRLLKEKPEHRHKITKPVDTAVRLHEIMAMLRDAEPSQEQVSIKEFVKKSGVKIFEEPTPNEPGDRAPFDGGLQGLHFIAQVLRVNAGSPKIELNTLCSNLEGSGLRFGERRVANAIEKTYGVQLMTLPRYFDIILSQIRIDNYDLQNIIYWKLVRHHIRNEQPVFVMQKDFAGYAVITGFSIAPGKDPKYEAIMMDGAVDTRQLDKFPLPYKIRETSNVPQSEFILNSGIFIKMEK